MALFQINPNKVGKDWHALVRAYQGTGFQPVNVWANEMTYKRGVKGVRGAADFNSG
jgi:hypothetical protein